MITRETCTHSGPTCFAIDWASARCAALAEVKAVKFAPCLTDAVAPITIMLPFPAARISARTAIGQLIMHGREHLVGIAAHKKGLMLVILRYADELRKAEPYWASNVRETGVYLCSLPNLANRGWFHQRS